MNAKIPMTAPVSMRILPGEGPNCESNYTMSFWIPSDFQEDTPAPSDPLLYIEERPGFEVVAKEFPGFPTENPTEFLGCPVDSARSYKFRGIRSL